MGAAAGNADGWPSRGMPREQAQKDRGRLEPTSTTDFEKSTTASDLSNLSPTPPAIVVDAGSQGEGQLKNEEANVKLLSGDHDCSPVEEPEALGFSETESTTGIDVPRKSRPRTSLTLFDDTSEDRRSARTALHENSSRGPSFSSSRQYTEIRCFTFTSKNLYNLNCGSIELIDRDARICGFQELD
ncbi:unnamed protein product, partial [Amoebophrya sp. A120]|eukprot:GSA120T00007652001.1